MTQLSHNFTLQELTRSQAAFRLGVDNQPGPSELANLARLAHDLLEPVRTLLGVPLHVDSGFRCEAVNKAVGSTSKHSAHLDGRAADIIPVGMDLREAFDKIRHAPGLPLDQIIIECNAWIHLAIAPAGQQPRHMALEAIGKPGQWAYSTVPA